MKKLALAVATSALGAYATAATVTEFANGVLVPQAVHQGSGSESTAVGLTSCAAGTVYWTFFDVDTKHVTDGQFNMTADDQAGFVWADEAGFGLTGQEGYLTFVLDTNTVPGSGVLDSSDSPCLAGNAFYVDIPNNDVAYVPALPLSAADGDFGPAVAGVYEPNLTLMDENSIEDLAAGAQAGDVIYMRYFIDGAAGGTDTSIYIWSAPDISGAQTVNIYDADQNRKSVNVTLGNAELNTLDPEVILGRPEGFNDGFIKWVVPANGVVSWSVIAAPAFGAVQTVINPISR